MKKLELEGAYSNFFEDRLGSGEILGSQVEDSCQGSANYVILLQDGRYAIVEWSWGSCDYCCRYMGLSEEELAKELASCITYVDSKETLLKYIDNIVSQNSSHFSKFHLQQARYNLTCVEETDKESP